MPATTPVPPDAGHLPDAAAEPGDRIGVPPGTLDWLFSIISERQRQMPADSYVAGLLRQGVDRIARKVGEESAEVIIAAKNRSPDELAAEMADLWFHSLVMLADAGMRPEDVYRVLAARHGLRRPA
jgi:phosphoribosyl-ATP pyrophosphohydrolase